MEITEIYSHNLWQKFRESNVKIKELKRFTTSKVSKVWIFALIEEIHP